MMLVSNFALAESDFRVSGFGTIGFVTSDSNEFGYRADFSKTGGVFKSDIDFAESTNLGIQFDFIANEEFDIVVQAVYRDQDDFTLDSAISLAFIRYVPDTNWSFRLGRTAFDLFLLTEYRDIGYAYNWAHVPSEIYGLIPHRYVDGVDVTYSEHFGKMTFSSKLFFGKSKSTITAFSSPDSVPLGFKDIIGIALDFASVNWDIAINHTQLKFDSQEVKPLVEAMNQFDAFVPNFDLIWPDAIEFINGVDLDRKSSSYSSISGQYRFDQITVISEIAKNDPDLLSLKNSESGYLSGIYHIGEHNLFASIAFSQSSAYNLADSNVNELALSQVPGGSAVYRESLVILNYYQNNQKTLSVGWRWDFDENMSFKLQLDHTRIDTGGSTFWQSPEGNDNAVSRTGKVNTLFANVSFAY